MKFKNIISDESGVAYLLLVLLGFYIIIIGIAYNFIVDFTLNIVSILDTTYSYDSRFTMDADGTYGLNFLISTLLYILIPLLIIIIYYTFNKSQKPVQGY